MVCSYVLLYCSYIFNFLSFLSKETEPDSKAPGMFLGRTWFELEPKQLSVYVLPFGLEITFDAHVGKAINKSYRLVCFNLYFLK
jgi:hypothetical protein